MKFAGLLNFCFMLYTSNEEESDKVRVADAH